VTTIVTRAGKGSALSFAEMDANFSNLNNDKAETGGLPSFLARAWVNFNGTGTVAIRASGNVSSITDLSTGRYEVNFTTAMPDANFMVSTNMWNDAYSNYGYPSSASKAEVAFFGSDGTTPIDELYAQASIHR
jgi:hypothetical protein